MDIHAATSSYEAWLGSFCPLNKPDLDYKHKQMSSAKDPFPFFRGTYYRWTQLWPKTCPELDAAPKVLAVGDLHVENFGTWRDSEGRIAWGVNDFDEAAELAYTNDLVRLAASVRFARFAEPMDVKFSRACEVILGGYRGQLQAGGRPFVLEESFPELRALAMAEERDPQRFWTKLTAVLQDPAVEPPATARQILEKSLPAGSDHVELRFRPRVGMGSLGKPRYLALAQWRGGPVAREAKAITPSAVVWHAGSGNPPFSHMAEIVAHAVRSPDPCYQPGERWIVRRLAPRCTRIELTSVPNISDQVRLLEAMGAETANVHLGTAGAAAVILKDLDKRPADWLEAAAKVMAKALEADWEAWRI